MVFLDGVFASFRKLVACGGIVRDHFKAFVFAYIQRSLGRVQHFIPSYREF